MEFKQLESSEQLEQITAAGNAHIILKHNTTCPISKSVKQRLETEGEALSSTAPFYILDILSHRDVSDAIAGKFNVPHQSPQLLVIKGGNCIYNESLYHISASEAAVALKEAES